MRKITLILFMSAFFSVAVSAGTDGDNSLSYWFSDQDGSNSRE